YFIKFLTSHKLDVFAWYRVALAVVTFVWLATRGRTMWSWLQRTFITGFFVTVPLAVSVVAIIWVFQFADGLTAGLGERLLGRHIPGLGLLATALIVFAVGAIATNVFGRRVLQKSEDVLLHVPVFK